MSKSSIQKNQVYLKSINNDIYFEKNNVILDKICPNCKKILFEEKEFCDCGFFLKSYNNAYFWTAMVSAWLVIGIITLIGVISFDHIKTLSFKKINGQKLEFQSLSPINIQIISSLKNSPYNDYIQNIYTKPKEKNKLMILIRPTLWNTLTGTEKQELYDLVSKNWKVVYKQNYPASTKQPEVYFANPE